MTRSIVRGIAVAVALVGFGASAQAFTFQGAQGVTGGSALVDPDARFDQQKQTDRNGQTIIQNGNTTLRFGGSSSANQNFNPNRLFDPFYRDGR